DLHVAVRVLAEALAGRDPVVVDDAERAEAHVVGVVVIREGERVARVEPPVVRVPSLLAASNADRHRSLLPPSRKAPAAKRNRARLRRATRIEPARGPPRLWRGLER